MKTLTNLTIDSTESAERLVGLPITTAEKILTANKFIRGRAKNSKLTKVCTIEYTKRDRYGRIIIEITHPWNDGESFGISIPGPVSSVTFLMES